jgi:hypothetical protein
VSYRPVALFNASDLESEALDGLIQKRRQAGEGDPNFFPPQQPLVQFNRQVFLLNLADLSQKLI